jgi:D-alanyl-D-alanine carboxypeptidase/D-alanyl-D-alanine-endopeptidase (penicillin-binding protein 4)
MKLTKWALNRRICAEQCSALHWHSERLAGRQAGRLSHCGSALRRQSDRVPAFVLGILLFPFLSALLAQSAPGATPAGTLAELQARITDHLGQPQYARSTWGIKVVSLDTGVTVYEHDAGKLLKPASNAKLFTCALALDRLGSDYRIQTSLLSTAKPDRRGTLAGDLIVYGRGDPSFSARFNDGHHDRSLEPLIAALIDAGVKRVKGDLVGDDSYFHGPPFGSSWTWDDLQFYYGAEASALTHEDNVVDLVFNPGPRTNAPCLIQTVPATSFLVFINRATTGAAGGSRDLHFYRPVGANTVYVTGNLPLQSSNWTDAVAVHDPALWFATQLKDRLAARGIKVAGKARSVGWLDRAAQRAVRGNAVEIAAVHSRPLSEIVTKMMKASQNLYAQLLLLQVGALAEDGTRATGDGSRKAEGGGRPEPEAGNPESGTDPLTTEEHGLRELKAFLKRNGISPEDVLLDDGSGLSRRALVTPNAIVQLLTVMSRHPQAGTFRAALPVAGVDGTLRNRMKGTAAENNLSAKTGTIGYVFTLSGYVNTAGAETLAFSLMLNASDADSRTSRDDLDAIAVMLAEFRGTTRRGGLAY